MESNSSTTNNQDGFSSLAALRDFHSKLLKRYREEAESSELFKEIKEFIDRGRATGTILENDDDRWDGQSRLDYWAAILNRAGQELPDSTLAEFNPLTKLERTIERIATREYIDEDVLLLRQLLIVDDSKKLIQLGKYNVNIGQGKEIQIGDRIYQGAEAETIHQVIQQVLEARKFYALLTPPEFSDRAEQAALASHKGVFVGREAILNKLQQNLSEGIGVSILHGSGGIGKTRLLLSLADIIPEEANLWYLRNETESIEPELASLDCNHHHIIVVDDAHRCDRIHQLREVLVNPKLAGKVKLIFATRSVFKDSLIYQLGSLPDGQIDEIEIPPLENEDIDRYLQQAPYQINNDDMRHVLVKIAEGNPLIAGIAAGLLEKGEPLVNLNREQVLTRYLNEIIKDLTKAESTSSDSEQKYICYLQILSALGTVDLSKQEIQSKINEIVDISSFDEEKIISRLLEAGLIERYYKTIKIASEVLADHILIEHFFNSKTKQADYHKLILEPFFNLKPQAILTNLAEAEVKGESKEAGLLFGQKMNELYQALGQEGNSFRSKLLDCLRDVAYLKPDDILNIATFIIEDADPQSETIQGKFWGSYEIKHEFVLKKVVEILERTIYQGGLRDSINYLHKIATYQLATTEYGEVRKKASEALLKIAEFKPRKPYGVQLLLLDLIADWLKENFVINLAISLPLIQSMLKIEFHSAETDPIKPFGIIFQQGRLGLSDSLRQIRERSLNILYEAYEQTSNLSTRLQIVRASCGATPHITPGEDISAELLNFLNANCAMTARFFLYKVLSNAELPILDEIAEWVIHIKRFDRYQAEELNLLQQQLQNHKGYQLYRLLIGRCRYDEDDNLLLLNWEKADRKRQERIDDYVDSLSSLEQAIQELESILKQIRLINEDKAFGLNDILRIIGQKRLDFASEFVEQVLSRNLELKHHLGFALAGIRFRDREKARLYVQEWIEGDDPILWRAIALSYHFIDWSQPQLETEWKVLRQLVAKKSVIVDRELFWSISRLAPYNSELAVELLKILATRDNENTLHQVAEIVSSPNYEQDGETWAIQFNNLQDLWEIIENFERLPYLDYKVEECLARLGESQPTLVIDFIERRIKLKPNKYSKKEYYQAFPTPFSRAFNNIDFKPEYPDLLRRVRDWTIQDDFLLSLKAPSLLKALSLNLKGQLYDILMEWVEAKNIDKLKAIATILREFNTGEDFYNLSREIITRTQDENILSSVGAAIHLTPGAIMGGFSNFYKQRIEEVSPWQKDDIFQVRQFAKRVIQSLQQDVERAEAQEDLEKRSW
ncbi:hypothetical protein C7B64_01730 [Merismopedia glauca CCAP 1448/3]|uniref:Effector-associated domain-containing protein n=2 Tax=Merismopedia TaxID=53402 RepID=A0A2T1C9X3_9CYAN|nr:hypothetical protein C7B64_01730 [Merismopedia glauca CCAP 1448/3]